MLDIMVIAAHPDDAELGMGGAVVRFVRQGLRVGILDLTNGEPTPRGSRAIRAAETAAATRVLGVPWRQCLGLVNRSVEPSLDARRRLAGAIRAARPRLLFAPYWEDAHPDHVAATALIEAARFWAKLTKSDLPGAPWFPERIYYYFSVHLRVVARPSFVLDVTDAIEAKMQALACYRSQLVDNQPAGRPTVLDDIRDRARYWGWAIGRPFGEPFVSRETIGLSSLEHLL